MTLAFLNVMLRILMQWIYKCAKFCENVKHDKVAVFIART